jgi:ABC-2 type transport system permease protein
VLGMGCLMHRAAIHHQAGLIQSSSRLMIELLQFTLLAGTTLVIVLTAGTISSERGIMADSVLSRGISRHQYFLGKWHGRLVSVLGSFFFVGVLVLAASCFLLERDLSIVGSLLALVLVAAVFAMVISTGVAISSMSQSTVLGIAVSWMVVYGVGVGLWLLGWTQLDPGRILRLIANLVQGEFSWAMQWRLIGWCALASVVVAVAGMFHFSRCDV